MGLIKQDVFGHMISSLYNIKKIDKTFSITKSELASFEKDYIFTLLQKPIRFGMSFCEKYDLVDYLLMGKVTEQDALDYIRKNYIK